MIVGEINNLKVKRVSDIAYILEDGEEELFLHKKEANKEHVEGDMVDVFIYMDSKRRICASEKTPLITASKPAFLKVVDIREGVGYFLYDGMPKDLLLAEDDAVFEENEKPVVGDELFVSLKVSPGTFRARLVPKAAYTDLMRPTTTLREKDLYECIVVNRTPSGVVCYTREGHEIFVSRGNDRTAHRIGEAIKVQILKRNEGGGYQGTLLKYKTTQLDEDARKIYNYLKANKNEVISEEDSPIDIYSKFQMSKAAFKRAVGRLYKERLIEINSGIIRVIM